MANETWVKAMFSFVFGSMLSVHFSGDVIFLVLPKHCLPLEPR